MLTKSETDFSVGGVWVYSRIWLEAWSLPWDYSSRSLILILSFLTCGQVIVGMKVRMWVNARAWRAVSGGASLSCPERFEGKTRLLGKVRGVVWRWETAVQVLVEAAHGRTVTMLFVRELNV